MKKIFAHPIESDSANYHRVPIGRISTIGKLMCTDKFCQDRAEGCYDDYDEDEDNEYPFQEFLSYPLHLARQHYYLSRESDASGLLMQ